MQLFSCLEIVIVSELDILIVFFCIVCLEKLEGASSTTPSQIANTQYSKPVILMVIEI